MTALSAAAPLACGEEFAPASRVEDFRLIAVRADKPYAAPGEKVSITTLSHEPFGRPITWAWATCVKPIATTADACLATVVANAQATGKVDLTMGQGLSTFETMIPANILDGVPAEAASNVYVGVLTVACPGTLSVRDPATLARGALPFRCDDATTGQELGYERYVVSVKRIYVRRTDRNQNPALPVVTWDGQPWPEDEVKEVTPCKNDPLASIDDCDGGEQHVLAALTPPETVESGTSELGTPFTEDVVVQYYGTQGLFQWDARAWATPESKWAARASAGGREQTLWFVVRENRGGVSWTTRRVRVR